MATLIYTVITGVNQIVSEGKEFLLNGREMIEMVKPIVKKGRQGACMGVRHLLTIRLTEIETLQW